MVLLSLFDLCCLKTCECREIVESEGERIDVEEYVNDSDPSILRFLLASREEVCCMPVFYC